MTCLLHKFPPALIADMSIFSKCRAMIIFDRMNSYKTLIDRDVVTSRHFVPSEQPLQEAALFSLCGIQTIITNHWSTKPEDNFEIFTKLLTGSLTDGLYLGASVKKYWKDIQMTHDTCPEDTPMDTIMGYKDRLRGLFKHNTCTYGVPLVRIV